MTTERAMHAHSVEIQGTWLANVGAQQLLEATARRVRAADPDVTIALDPRWGRRAARPDLDLVSILPRAMPGDRFFEGAMAVARRVAPRPVDRLLARSGWTTRRDVDALIDASGFALSDQWGARKAEQRWAVIWAYASARKPVVLIPQAMGPFTDLETARAASRILRAADLVWVRDRRSLAHARELVGDLASVAWAPDVTILESGIAPASAAAAVVLVPNGRLLSHGGWDRSDYVGALVEAGRIARAADRDVEVLLHTSEALDRALGAEVADALACTVVHEPDPRVIKGRIGTAELVVGSRFHALLGALSQGVPAVALGWSHKYEELFADFGVPHLAPVGRERTTTPEVVREVLAAPGPTRAAIAAHLPELRAQVERMWTSSLAVLGIGATPDGATVR